MSELVVRVVWHGIFTTAAVAALLTLEALR